MKLFIKILLLFFSLFSKAEGKVMHSNQSNQLFSGKEVGVLFFIPDSTMYNQLFQCRTDYENPKCIYNLYSFSSAYKINFDSFFCSIRTNPAYYINFKKNKNGEFEYVGKEKISTLVVYDKLLDNNNNIPLSTKNLKNVEQLCICSRAGLPNNIGDFSSIKKIINISSNTPAYNFPINISIPESFYKLYQLEEFHSSQFHVFDANKLKKLPKINVIETSCYYFPLSDFIEFMNASLAFDLGAKVYTTWYYGYSGFVKYLQKIKPNLLKNINDTALSFNIDNQKYCYRRVDEHKVVFNTTLPFDSVPGVIFEDATLLDYQKKWRDSAKLEIELTNQSLSKITLTYSIMGITYPLPNTKEDLKRRTIVEFNGSDISVMDYSLTKIDTTIILKQGNDIVFSKTFKDKKVAYSDTPTTYDLNVDMECKYKNFIFDTLTVKWGTSGLVNPLNIPNDAGGFIMGPGIKIISKKDIEEGIAERKMIFLTFKY